MSSLLANNFLEYLFKKEIDFDADVFKIILLESGYVFDRVAHTTYADVSSYELPTAHGYTVGGATLSGVVVAQDDVNNGASVTWNNATWTATGNITASGAIIYDDTHADDIICGYIDFGGDQTCLAGGVASIADPTIQLLG